MDIGIRELVQRRAGHRCEYCHFPQSGVPYLVFHVDHIVAKQHLDTVSDDPRSLAWACSQCNFHKGPNLTSIDPQTGEQVNLFNPRTDHWDKHFSIEQGTIVGQTAAGRATARLLNMNAPRLVRLRRELIEMSAF
jgi:hypothetical protein